MRMHNKKCIVVIKIFERKSNDVNYLFAVWLSDGKNVNIIFLVSTAEGRSEV